MKKFYIFIIFFSWTLVFCNENIANQNEILALQQQLDQEKQNLEQRKQALDSLTSQQQRQAAEVGISYPSQINADVIQIQNLTDALQNLRAAQSSVNESATAALRQQSIAGGLARDQIDPAIALLQQNIIQTQGQIYVWTNNVFPLKPEQRTLLDSLQNRLALQNQQLEILNQQKLNINSQLLQQTRFIASTSEQRRNELADNQAALQDEIFSMRAELDRLRSAQAQARMSIMPLTQQLSQARKSYQEQLEKVKALEESLSKKNLITQ